MDIIQAFVMGEMNRGKEMMVFDWDHAARIIREKNPVCASAGLRSDWECTGGTIYENGKINTDDYTFLASTWAVPELDLDGERIPCYVMESQTKWDAKTKWPASARKILKGGD